MGKIFPRHLVWIYAVLLISTRLEMLNAVGISVILAHAKASRSADWKSLPIFKISLIASIFICCFNQHCYCSSSSFLLYTVWGRDWLRPGECDRLRKTKEKGRMITLPCSTTWVVWWSGKTLSQHHFSNHFSSMEAMNHLAPSVSTVFSKQRQYASNAVTASTVNASNHGCRQKTRVRSAAQKTDVYLLSPFDILPQVCSW